MSTLRRTDAADLVAVNAVVREAIRTWNMPARLERLVIGTYEYGADDLNTMVVYALPGEDRTFRAVLALEDFPGDEADTQEKILLLHGIYVSPYNQREGVGRALVEFALNQAVEREFDGVLIKAHASAAGFFRSVGLIEVPVEDPSRDYPHRYWWPNPGRTL